MNMVKIFIDPGHGGTDPGAVGNGLNEKDITLQIASRVRDSLLSGYQNVSVLMSRTGDQTVSLTERTNAANAWGADYFLSIHINAGGGTGYEDYIYPGSSAATSTYQNNIHSEVMKAVNFSDRGKKTANFHVLRESNMPAILTENGFIDTASDAGKLKTASFLDALARGHVNGLVKSFSLQPKTGTFLIRVTADSLNYYNAPDWNAIAGQVSKGEVFTAVETLWVSGSKMYKLKSGNYITGNSQYVEII